MVIRRNRSGKDLPHTGVRYFERHPIDRLQERRKASDANAQGRPHVVTSSVRTAIDTILR